LISTASRRFGCWYIMGQRLGASVGVDYLGVGNVVGVANTAGSFGSLAPPTPIRRYAHTQLVSLPMQDMVIKRALQVGRDLRLWGDFGAERFFDLGGDPVGVAEQDTGGKHQVKFYPLGIA
jgi:hypothetical protein